MAQFRATSVTYTDVPRAGLLQENLAVYPVPWTAFRVWDAFQTNLPGTPATDDLGLVGGTFGTDPPSLQTEDLKAAGATNNYARFVVALPPEYVAGESVQVRCSAAMLTTVADTSATLDVVAYESDREIGISADLVTTSATSINSLTWANYSFSLTSTNLAPGDLLDVRLQTAVNERRVRHGGESGHRSGRSVYVTFGARPCRTATPLKMRSRGTGPLTSRGVGSLQKGHREARLPVRCIQGRGLRKPNGRHAAIATDTPGSAVCDVYCLTSQAATWKRQIH